MARSLEKRHEADCLAVRERIEARAAEHGVPALHAELARRAPAAAARLDPADRTRVVRALELLEMGEEPAPAGAESRLWTARLRHPTLLCGLVMEREALYERIDARVDEMVAAGAAVRSGLRPRPAPRHGARRARLRGAVARRRRGDNAHAQLRKTPAALIRRLPEVERVDLTAFTMEAGGRAANRP